MDPALTSSPGHTFRRVIDHLAVADPKAADALSSHLIDSDSTLIIDCLAQVVDEVIHALAEEISFGRILADGMGRMLAEGSMTQLDRYRAMVKKAVEKGPTLARLFALHLIPVLACSDPGLADRFEMTTRVMLQKGTYTLKAPLETLSALIQDDDLACAHAFLDLLSTTYALETSYNRTVYLTHTLPRAVDGFSPTRRLWQIRGLARIIGEDGRLADAYLQGLTSGLHLLSEAVLNEFIDEAIRRYQIDPAIGVRFLSLESRQGLEYCHDLQVAVPLCEVQSQLERYLQARTGMAIAIRPLSTLTEKRISSDDHPPLVLCDGKVIYLPDEMDVLDHRKDNADFYKLLVRLEASGIEFGTFDLDMEKTLSVTSYATTLDTDDCKDSESDLSRFIGLFEHPVLALDLFTLIEHGRIARHVRHHYPGLMIRITNALTDQTLLTNTSSHVGGTLFSLYRHVVMNEQLPSDSSLNPYYQEMAERFHQLISVDRETVETSARLVLEFYPKLAGLFSPETTAVYCPLVLPFGRRLSPTRFSPFHGGYERLAADIQQGLADKNIRVFRSDIRRLLVRQNGMVSKADIRTLIVDPSPATNGNGSGGKSASNLSWLDLKALMCNHGIGQSTEIASDANAFHYREWDWCMGDYLQDRVRVLEQQVQGTDPGFYLRALDDHRGLVRRIRYAFELLKPEEMTILRQWREGDAFDYRALLDYAVDKKAGLIPSDRLFIKRMKKVRDVAALLLVDLSRSTANAVDDRGTRVLDVEKQAIVLLCEALNVVGDRFAIAGFSGTGPLGVDYYRIKDLDSPMDDAVKGRISAMAPQRSTRMGAAIRHATAVLSSIQARVRLIIILGDGFPNDLEYKGPYAVEDTRQAIMEARTAAIHVKAITINASGNGQLDRLYGSAHHTLIGAINDLPDKLVRVYSALTRP